MSDVDANGVFVLVSLHGVPEKDRKFYAGNDLWAH